MCIEKQNPVSKMMLNLHQNEDDAENIIIKMKTGLHQNEDGLGRFWFFFIIKMKTSLIYHIHRALANATAGQPNRPSRKRFASVGGAR